MPLLVRSGATMLESLVVVGLLAVVLGGAFVVIRQFQSGFAQGDATAAVQNRAFLILAALRRDLANATVPAGLPSARWGDALAIDGNSLRLTVHVDGEGATREIRWEVDGNRVLRIEAGQPHVIASDGVASWTWSIGREQVGRPALRKLWLNLGFTTVAPPRPGSPSLLPVGIRTRMYPRRLLRLLNGTG